MAFPINPQRGSSSPRSSSSQLNFVLLHSPGCYFAQNRLPPQYPEQSWNNRTPPSPKITPDPLHLQHPAADPPSQVKSALTSSIVFCLLLNLSLQLQVDAAKAKNCSFTGLSSSTGWLDLQSSSSSLFTISHSVFYLRSLTRREVTKGSCPPWQPPSPSPLPCPACVDARKPGICSPSYAFNINIFIC